MLVVRFSFIFYQNDAYNLMDFRLLPCIGLLLVTFIKLEKQCKKFIKGRMNLAQVFNSLYLFYSQNTEHKKLLRNDPRTNQLIVQIPGRKLTGRNSSLRFFK